MELFMQSDFLVKCKCGFTKIVRNNDVEFVRMYEIKQNCNCSGKKFKCPNCGYATKAKRVKFS